MTCIYYLYKQQIRNYMFSVTLSTDEKSIHPCVPKLLVGKAFLGKYVCK